MNNKVHKAGCTDFLVNKSDFRQQQFRHRDESPELLQGQICLAVDKFALTKLLLPEIKIEFGSQLVVNPLPKSGYRGLHRRWHRLIAVRRQATEDVDAAHAVGKTGE